MPNLNSQVMIETVSKIVSKLGVDVLKDAPRFNSAMCDFMPGVNFEIERNILTICARIGICEQILGAIKKSEAEKESIVKNINKKLIEGYGFSHERVSLIIDVFSQALHENFTKFLVDAKKNTTSETKSEAIQIKDNVSSTSPYLRAIECFRVGEDSKKNQNWTVAFANYKEAAGLGHSDAQYQLGLFYEWADGTSSFTNYKKVFNKNSKEAIKWYTRAAEKGNTDAQVRLGNAFYYGQLGFNRNWSKGVKWYIKAADQRNNLAKTKVSKAYEMGDEASWGADSFRELALDGNDVAQCKLGDCYLHGFGVPKHIGVARHWYEKAALNNNKLAMERLKQIDKEGDLSYLYLIAFLLIFLFFILVSHC